MSDPIDCPWCGEWTRTIYVNGSEKCPRCKRTVEDCCNGEQANESKPRKDDTVLDTVRDEASDKIVSQPIPKTAANVG